MSKLWEQLAYNTQVKRSVSAPCQITVPSAWDALLVCVFCFLEKYENITIKRMLKYGPAWATLWFFQELRNWPEYPLHSAFWNSQNLQILLSCHKSNKIQMTRRKWAFFFPPGLHCDFYFVPEKEGTDKCINELCRELLLKDNSAVFPWQYVKRRNYLIVAASGKEIRAIPVHKWQNIKMLQRCVPRANERVLSLMKDPWMYRIHISNCAV